MEFKVRSLTPSFSGYHSQVGFALGAIRVTPCATRIRKKENMKKQKHDAEIQNKIANIMLVRVFADIHRSLTRDPYTVANVEKAIGLAHVGYVVAHVRGMDPNNIDMIEECVEIFDKAWPRHKVKYIKFVEDLRAA